MSDKLQTNPSTDVTTVDLASLPGLSARERARKKPDDDKPLTEGEEKFAQAIARGATWREAARLGGYSGDHANAIRRAQIPRIKARIEFLRMAMGDLNRLRRAALDDEVASEIRDKTTLQTVVDELMMVARDARDGGNHKDAIGALMSVAKLMGYDKTTDKDKGGAREDENPNGAKPPAPISISILNQLDRQLAGENGGLEGEGSTLIDVSPTRVGESDGRERSIPSIPSPDGLEGEDVEELPGASEE
jgi:hypothetical protein